MNKHENNLLIKYFKTFFFCTYYILIVFLICKIYIGNERNGRNSELKLLV